MTRKDSGVAVFLLLAAVNCCLMGGGECAPARSGDLVFFKRFTTSKGKLGDLKMTILSPAGQSRSSLVLPKLQNKTYDAAAVSGRFAFFCVIPNVPKAKTPTVEAKEYYFPTISMDVAVVDIGLATPKVVAVLPVPTSSLAVRSGEQCGWTGSKGSSNIAVRQAGGSGQGSYRIALSISCREDQPKSFPTPQQSCQSRTLVHTITFNPKTPRTLSEKPAQPICKLYKFLSLEAAEERCVGIGPFIVDQKLAWQGGTRMAFMNEYGGEADLISAGLYNVNGLSGRKPIEVASFVSWNKSPYADCKPTQIASTRSFYAACFRNIGNPPTRTISVVEVSNKSRQMRVIGTPLREAAETYQTFFTNTRTSTPIYLVTQIKASKTYKLLAAAKQSRSAFKPAFTTRLNIGGSSMHVLE